jgi:hypothetical protein
MSLKTRGGGKALQVMERNEFITRRWDEEAKERIIEGETEKDR